MPIEQNAAAYISANYTGMANGRYVFSDSLPEDNSGDCKASTANIGQLISCKLGTIKNDEGNLTVPFDILVEGDLHSDNGDEQAGVNIAVSGELWGVENPFRAHNDDPDYVGENPNAFLYKPSQLSVSLG